MKQFKLLQRNFRMMNRAKLGSNIQQCQKVKCYCCGEWLWAYVDEPKTSFLCWKCWCGNIEKGNHLPLSQGCVTATYVNDTAIETKKYNEQSEEIKDMFRMDTTPKPVLVEETNLEEIQLNELFVGKEDVREETNEIREA